MGTHGGPPGDLFILISVRPHPRFRRDGYNLVTTLDISFVQAALGLRSPSICRWSRAQPAYTGRDPAGNGLDRQRQRVTHLQGHRIGDLKVIIDVKIPTRLSKKQRELWRPLPKPVKNRNPVVRHIQQVQRRYWLECRG